MRAFSELKVCGVQAQLRCNLLLEWAAVLSDDVQFNDAPRDSVRVLQAAEKYCAAWACCAPAQCAVVLDVVATLTGTPLLRALAVGRFFDPILERLNQPESACAQSRSFSFMKLADLPASLLLDVWQYCPNLTEVRFIRCTSVIR